MRHLRNPSLLGATILTLALLGAAAPAAAQVSISVSPALLELEGNAGDTGTFTITLTNKGDEDIEIATGLQPFQAMTDERSALDWGTVTPERVPVPAASAVTVEYTIDIPEDAPSGGRYGAITLTTVPVKGATTTGVAGQIVVPVLITVNGDGDLVTFTELGRNALFLEPDGRLGARVEIISTGNTHVPFAGTLTVTGVDPAVEAKLDIADGRVLPGRTRIYSTETTLPLPMGASYTVTIAMGEPDAEERLTDTPVHSATFDVLADAGLALSDLAMCETLDGGPRVSATLASTGTLGLIPAVTFSLVDDNGTPIERTEGATPPLLWPQDAVLVDGRLSDPLPSGSYTLVAAAEAADGVTAEQQLAVSIGGDPSTAAPLCPPSDPSASPAG